MKKLGFLFAAALSFFALCPLSFAGQDDLGLVEAKGIVNTSEIAGPGLYVFSMWNGADKALIGSDGCFSVSILSGARPQKLAVRDAGEKTRALAFVLSQDPQDIVFDAASTAMVVLFNDPGAIKNAQDMEYYSNHVAKARSFQELVFFLKKNLPFKPLEKLVRDKEYVMLFENCNRELFDVDRSAVKRSLSEAQGELERSFGE
jgi:hypothetical protein